MKILLFHPVLLPPRSYGGVERVVLWLAKGLVQRGHQVLIGALPGSQLPKGCQLLPLEARHYNLDDYARILPRSLDVTHFMAPIPEGIWNYLPTPAVLTVHGNAKPGERYPKNSVFLTRDHARRHHGEQFVYNGIDPEEFLYEPDQKHRAFLFLSKTSWKVKNLKGAIRYCKRARVPLQIAGGNRPFLRRVQCQLSSQLTWLGPVAGNEKAKILAHARGLVFPVIWPEPFGLVIAEALMSGTPVIGSPLGSLPELITDHVGSLPRTNEEWIEALNREIPRWQAEHCRNYALEKFHYLKMAESYEKVYQRVIKGESLNVRPPTG